jgi:UDP-N-acetylmuramoylalanine--D-glutamate ligase
MIPVASFADRNVALFGLGGSGLSAARALVEGGARLSAWDDSEKARASAVAAGVSVVDLHDADWSKFEALALAPGVPLTHPQPHWTVLAARAAGVPVIGDIELFCRERAARAPGAPFIAITGTNGKSTTTALIAHLLREAGRDVQLGGNIGVPILDLAPPSATRAHVIECSSFQIDLAPSLDPSIGLLINLTPDHLDRHGTMAQYAAIKERLVAGAGVAVIGVDDDFSRAIYERRLAQSGPENVVAVSVLRPLADGVFVDGSRIIRTRPGAASETLGDIAGIASLRGAHNAQNAAMACAAAHLAGVAPATIARALRTFPGLAHRMEAVGRMGRVLFVNDSKATNADAAEKALLSFRDIYWIAGGKAKEGGIAPLRPLFPRIAKAYLIGAASEAFAATLGADVPYTLCGALDAAVAAAANFEARGDAFRALAQALIASPQQGQAHALTR